ncbi:TetR/AcrR family transcriptional regulator C-terminal ligand-binding domain-containing protein [Mycobacterium sp. DSM 3803]|nr:TetR/AcrR family transcriptional regulator C-terminal ligand-binding domain-containing protein [Mycobacterium sp. DSM 3803]
MVDRPNPDRQVRGAKLRALVLDATIARIEAVGIDNVRIADIAEAARVHETSLYRRWKTLSRLLVDALVSRTAAEIPIPDTGSVESDLETFTADLARFAQTRAGTAMIRSTVVSDTDPEVEAARREFWLQRLSAAEEIIKRGITRGEVAADTDAQLVVLTLGGLVHLYVSHIGDPIPADLPQRVVRLVLPGIAPK